MRFTYAATDDRTAKVTAPDTTRTATITRTVDGPFLVVGQNQGHTMFAPTSYFNPDDAHTAAESYVGTGKLYYEPRRR